MGVGVFVTTDQRAEDGAEDGTERLRRTVKRAQVV